jgi:hypothetical protein
MPSAARIVGTLHLQQSGSILADMQRAGSHDKTERPQPNRWHAVSVVARGFACPLVRALRGHRFLSNEAPGLPLSCCQRPEQCHCIYRHYEDRRNGPRRKVERGYYPTAPTGNVERRKRSSRRSTDS